MADATREQKNGSRFNPLFLSSFSGLNSSVRSTLSNQSRDSGYHDSSLTSCNSSFNSTLSSDFESTHLHSSTPLACNSSRLFDHQTRISTLFTPPTQTPVNREQRQVYSSDRIVSRTSLPDPLPEDESEIEDFVTILITRRIGTRQIFQYLPEADLLRFCQVNSVYCSAVCDDRHALKRLSRYLKTEQQDIENRATRRNRRRDSRILREIQNVLPSQGNSNEMELLPSAVELLNLGSIPRRLKSLIDKSRSLVDDQYLAVCHSCQSFAVRPQQVPGPATCGKCRTKRNLLRKIKTSPVRPIQR
jgi:hypothetical protein